MVRRRDFDDPGKWEFIEGKFLLTRNGVVDESAGSKDSVRQNWSEANTTYATKHPKTNVQVDAASLAEIDEQSYEEKTAGYIGRVATVTHINIHRQPELTPDQITEPSLLSEDRDMFSQLA